jgi:hypothetical protein
MFSVQSLQSKKNSLVGPAHLDFNLTSPIVFQTPGRLVTSRNLRER